MRRRRVRLLRLPQRRLTVMAAVLSAGVLLVGCSAVPHKKADLDVSKLAADQAQVDLAYRNFEKARAAAFTSLDADVLTLVESGPVLAIDAGAIDVAKRLHGSASTGGEVQEAEIEDVYVPRLGEYPLWFVTVARDPARQVRRVEVFERASSTERWELVASPQVVLDAVLPVPRTAEGAADHLDPASDDGLSTSPADAMAAYAAVLADPSSPRAADVVGDDSFASQLRMQQGALTKKGTTFTRTWDSQPVQHVLRTEDGGALVFGTLMRQDSWVLAPGAVVRWPADSDQKAFLGDPMSGSGVLRYYHQVLMYVPPTGGSGKPRVLGQYGGVIGAEEFGVGASPSGGSQPGDLPTDGAPADPLPTDGAPTSGPGLGTSPSAGATAPGGAASPGASPPLGDESVLLPDGP